jgi:hypothetical protein
MTIKDRRNRRRTLEDRGCLVCVHRPRPRELSSGDFDEKHRNSDEDEHDDVRNEEGPWKNNGVSNKFSLEGSVT